jgi:hypothetical protein
VSGSVLSAEVGNFAFSDLGGLESDDERHLFELG